MSQNKIQIEIQAIDNASKAMNEVAAGFVGMGRSAAAAGPP